MSKKNGSIVWVTDTHGKSHVCYISDTTAHPDSVFENLPEHEKQTCYTEDIPWS